ncbi:hypothetical protein CDAR_481481 [Caerostris darwini]|uniref:Uncharacterized protein n=1 Tax=Caerostris darwini TaxID=1538125 RepID=A0AAV4NAB8_9ARAC|nr:hypothetical protein CDAR_481481 [Caerostris darwini]
MKSGDRGLKSISSKLIIQIIWLEPILKAVGNFLESRRIRRNFAGFLVEAISDRPDEAVNRIEVLQFLRLRALCEISVPCLRRARFCYSFGSCITKEWPKFMSMITLND